MVDAPELAVVDWLVTQSCTGWSRNTWGLANLVASCHRDPNTPSSGAGCIVVVVAKTAVGTVVDMALRTVPLVASRSGSQGERTAELGRQFRWIASSCGCDEGEIVYLRQRSQALRHHRLRYQQSLRCC